jgi:hypothetical protein
MKRRSYELIFKKFNAKLDKLLNKYECCVCSKLLYNTQICNIKFNNSIGEHLKLLYSYNNLNKNIEQVSQLTCCTTCISYIRQNKILYVYSDFGDIPEVINDVMRQNNYYMINKLCLITIYCKTLKTTSYSYLHQNGNPKMYHKTFKNFMGSIGLIYDEETIDNKIFTNESKSIILSAMNWLKKNNLLYKKYLCNYEKLIKYLISSSPDFLHMGSPMVSKNHLQNLEILNNDGKFATSGLLINVELENNCLPPNIKDVDVGIAIKRRKLDDLDFNIDIKDNIKYDDKDVESLIYVHLFPKGIGS